MSRVTELFGSLVFDDRAMRESLSAEVYSSLRKTIDEGARLDRTSADAVASAMKEWAVSKGATHFTHWFQPLTGITAEKHDSFIVPDGSGGVIMDFSGAELIQGEPDASSLPSGGLRATFEARGYTAWDPTSFAFIKDGTLCIPTAFCTYNGEALDKKTPLLRSMSALNRQALRVLRCLGEKDVKKVSAMVGAEQEYFLIPIDLYEKRPDLRYTGRTLFGAPSPKSQELDDHYFGAIKPGVAAFMAELNEELWKLGIAAKTEHNEVAPSQHELACVYSTVNVATDQNQLVMEIMKKTAEKHGFVCLLHEKPFAGVNGSGKHDNWSLATDTGVNLLSPGATPEGNTRFLIFLCAVIKAVDSYQDLLRLSVATAGNDHRLGGNEAPPAVISIFLGDELTSLLEAIAEDQHFEIRKQRMIRFGTEVLPYIRKDNTDRNRTSPFAFTGNKFEFRMPGASDSVAEPNIMLNSAVAESLRIFADRLEKAADPDEEVHGIIRDTMQENGRIIFNGNGYDSCWIREAGKRGLLNLPTTPDCIPRLFEEKNIAMLTGLGIFNKAELRSRGDIMLENYCKTELIEARTMRDIALRMLAPAAVKYASDLSRMAADKRSLCPAAECCFETSTVAGLASLTDEIYHICSEIASQTEAAAAERPGPASLIIRDRLIPLKNRLREACDAAESLCAKEYWPMPSYGELMFGAK